MDINLSKEMFKKGNQIEFYININMFLNKSSHQTIFETDQLFILLYFIL
jgi:hypothetical protein